MERKENEDFQALIELFCFLLFVCIHGCFRLLAKFDYIYIYIYIYFIIFFSMIRIDSFPHSMNIRPFSKLCVYSRTHEKRKRKKKVGWLSWGIFSVMICGPGIDLKRVARISLSTKESYLINIGR